MTEEKAIDIVRPLVTVEDAKKQWDIFENLKRQLLVEEDYQKIAGKPFIKRSGFRKIAVFFGISDHILKEERVERPDGSFVWRISVEAVAPNGRISVGVGACDSEERKGWAHKEHDCYSTAHTRAKSRAISDMIAGGLVSAEEVEASQPDAEARPAPPPERAANVPPALHAEPQWDLPSHEYLQNLNWQPVSARALKPPGTLYIFGTNPEVQILAETMERDPTFQAIVDERLRKFTFGPGNEGPETFINAEPV